MKCRRKFDYDESLNSDEPYREIFLGGCYGVLLKERNIYHNDKHVLVQLIVEDDGIWHIPYKANGSSHWFEDIINVLQEAHEWCEKHCEKDGQYGWKFKN